MAQEKQKADDITVIVERSPGDAEQYRAIIQDTPSQRAWTGEGNTAGKATTEATRKFLVDRRSREYVGG